MKKFSFFTLLAFLFSTGFVFAQNKDEEATKAATKKRLQNEYIQFLKEEGFTPSIDEDGDVEFESEGETYYIRPSIDPLYLSMFIFLSNTDNVHDLKIYQAVNVANKQYKAIKVYLTDDFINVVINASNYLHEESDFKVIFYRCLKPMKIATQFFQDEYTK